MRESSPEVEPRVLTEDVRRVLLPEVRDTDEDEGESVAMLAEKAGTSTRTIYRIMGGKTHSVSLGLADRLLLATGHYVHECRLVWPDGRIE